ncbi:uncharacterized protein LOC135077310 [Ostrinia nubilalis]|uniref:uncharacterized protein LOC135077310 n=1 Tax=Ostrinia nubilalis TaxID=29057 RepID=UPI0030825467
MRTMFNNFTDSQNQKLSSIQNSVTVIKEQNDEIVKSLDFLSQKYDEMREEIDSLRKEQKESRNYIDTLERKIEQLERKSKSNEVEIRNIPKPTGLETTQDLRKSLQNICSAIGVNIGDGEIKALYRINTKIEINKPIIVDFVSSTCKERLLSGLKSYNAQYSSNKLNTKHLHISGPERRIFISESLTFKAKKLFRMARDFATENKYQYCWTSHGTVYLRQREGLRALKITSEEDLPVPESSSK